MRYLTQNYGHNGCFRPCYSFNFFALSLVRNGEQRSMIGRKETMGLTEVVSRNKRTNLQKVEAGTGSKIASVANKSVD